jgi:molecular chaperone DnaJ
MAEHDTRYAISISLEEAASGCQKTIKVKTSETCPLCNGSGEKASTDHAPCPKCSGTGLLYQLFPISVDIPPGIDDGYQLCVKTRAQPEYKGKIPREVNVLVSVRAHQIFQRDGANIMYQLTLNFPQAALGTEVMVPTLREDTALRIPPGTQTGKVFRLKGKGITRFGRSGKGDLLVNIVVATPTSLDEHQRQLLEQLAEKLPRPHLGKSSAKKQSGDG